METIGSRLKQSRERRGFTQQAVANKLGITNGAVSGYERDYRDPDTDMLVKMAELYDVSVDWLLGRTKEPGDTLSQGEKELLTSIQLKDDEALKNFKFLYGDVELPEEVRAKAIAILRTLLENEPHLQEKPK